MENPVRESDDYYAQHEEDVGEFLRKTREKYGKTLPDVERVLRIRECQLSAIEAGDISKLPGRVYAIGFVRTYAEYLGLDGGEIVKIFKAQYMDAQPKQTLELAFPASDTKIPSFGFAVFLTLILFAGGYFWMNYNKSDRSIVIDVPVPPGNTETQPETTIPEAEVTDIPVPVSEESVPVAPSEAQTSETSEEITPVSEDAAVNDEKKGITLKMVENSWVEIKDAKGKVIVSDVLKTGDQYFVPDNPGLTMSLGNAGGVEIVLNGKVMKALGKTGDIRRDIPLNTDYLKTLEFREDQPAETETPDSAAEEKTKPKVNDSEPE